VDPETRQHHAVTRGIVSLPTKTAAIVNWTMVNGRTCDRGCPRFVKFGRFERKQNGLGWLPSGRPRNPVIHRSRNEPVSVAGRPRQTARSTAPCRSQRRRASMMLMRWSMCDVRRKTYSRPPTGSGPLGLTGQIAVRSFGCSFDGALDACADSSVPFDRFSRLL
jgi:hypothetical protein